MGRWSNYYGMGLLLLVPTAMVMFLMWLCQLTGLWGVGEKKEETRKVRQSTSKELTIPGDVVGYVIGRHGNRVREIEDQTGARIKFKDLEATEDKVAVMSGREECVNAAEDALRKAIEEKINQKEPDSVTLSVPQSAVGKIIGRQGTNIRTLQRESGARIIMSRGEEEGPERTCTVTGSKEQIACAVALIKEAIQQSELSHKRKQLQRRQARSQQYPSDGLPQLKNATLTIRDDYFGAFISAVDSEGGVWVQQVEGSDPTMLDTLVLEMKEDYSKLSPQADRAGDVSVGAVVAAPFHLDDSWYRSKVTDVDTLAGTAEVLYVDFGDSSQVELAQIKRLRSEYFNLPVQAVRCKLAGIQPKGGVWSKEALEDLDRLTLCATWRVVMVKVCGEDTTDTPTINVVDTTTDEDIDVAEELVVLGHAKWTDWRADVVQMEWRGEASEVCIAGSFTDWRPTEMEQMGPGVFRYRVHLPEAGCYQYKFMVDGEWQHDDTKETIDDGLGGLNNILKHKTDN